MSRKTSEKKRKKEDPLSAASKNIVQTTSKKESLSSIHFYEPFKCKNTVQKDLINLILQKEIIIASGPAGVGKAQPLYSKILTPSGWLTMGDIKIGDLIIGSDGNTIAVTGVHPQGIKEIFRVYFSDGSYTDCCDEHLWLTQTYYDRNYRIKTNGVRKSKPRVGTVKSLNQIMETIHTERGDKNHIIPIVCEVNFEPKKYIVDPYLIGCLLGDGGLTQNRITLTTADNEIIEQISKKLPKKHEIIKKSGNYAYSIIGENKINLVLDELTHLSMKNIHTLDKFIPDLYKFNSVEVRLEVLRGLMDTDGYVNKKGTSVFFTNTSKKLVDDVGFIVNSLGGIFTISEKHGKYKNSSNEYITCKKAYTLTISLPPHINPFKLNRKAQLVKPKSRYIPKRYITSVEPIGDFEAQCITVDAKDSLYVTDNFIVTHNSYVTIAKALELLKDTKNLYNKIIISKPAIEAGEKLGFLPGPLREKMDPVMASSLDIFDKLIGRVNRTLLEELGYLEIQTLAYIRGKSIDNTILIMEEAQNMTPAQMKTLLTRIGDNSKFIISGDLDQSDVFKDITKSGLFDAINRHQNIPEIGFIEFDESQIVRNKIISKILANYKTKSVE